MHTLRPRRISAGALSCLGLVLTATRSTCRVVPMTLWILTAGEGAERETLDMIEGTESKAKARAQRISNARAGMGKPRDTWHVTPRRVVIVGDQKPTIPTVWRLAYGHYMDDTTVGVVVGTRQKADAAAAVLTAERLGDINVARDLTEVRVEPLDVYGRDGSIVGGS